MKREDVAEPGRAGRPDDPASGTGAVLQVLGYDSYPVQPWRNGRGILRSITQGDGWQLRLADIEQSGAFSDYGGHLRLFAIVQGAVVLRMPSGQEVACDPQSPIATFDGGAPPQCDVIGGPALALNLIVEPHRVAGRLERQAVGEGFLAVTGESGAVVAIHVQSGEVECHARLADGVSGAMTNAEGATTKYEGSLQTAKLHDTLISIPAAGLLLRAGAGGDSMTSAGNAMAVVLVARIRAEVHERIPPRRRPGH